MSNRKFFRSTVKTSSESCDIVKPMDPPSVRLIPRVFDKLFFYTAPGDAVVGENVHCILGPIASRQLQYRLTQPKNGMFMLAWPLCMHSSEDVKSFYREVNFYDILRSNVVKNTSNKAVYVHENVKLRDFMSGFETRMLHCVLNSTADYSELNVLMLDFHTREAEICRSDIDDECTKREASDEQTKWFLKEIPKPPPRETVVAKSTSTVSGEKPQIKKAAPVANEQRAVDKNDLTRMRLWINDEELWGRAISTVAAQCAPKLKHFVLIDSYWVPEGLHYNLKLDSVFAQMQLVETIYLPHLQGYRRSGAKHPCWQALHDLPKEKRLPRLRRVVLDSPRNLMLQRPWSGVATEMNAEHGFSESVSSMDVRKQPSATSRLPLIQLHSLLSKFIIEVFGDSCQKWFENVKLHPIFEPAEKVKIVERRLENLNIQINQDSFHDEAKLKKPYDARSVQKFVNNIEKLVAQAVEDRQQHLSVLNCVKSTALLPAEYEFPNGFACDSAACMLNALSTRLSWPLSLTLEMSWSDLFDYMPFFIKEGDSIPPKWLTCFPRGQLKIKLDNEKPLREYLSGNYGIDKEKSKLMAKLVPENRYSFPPVTIHYKQCMELVYGKDDIAHIKKKFKECMETIIGDITGTIPPLPREDDEDEEEEDPYEEKEMSEEEELSEEEQAQQDVDDAKHLEAAERVTAATRKLRNDLYASAHKIVFHFAVKYMLLETDDSGIRQEVEDKYVRRLRALLQDKQLEYELMLEVFEKAFPKDQQQQQQQFLPNLKSVSITSEVDVDYYLALGYNGPTPNQDYEDEEDENEQDENEEDEDEEDENEEDEDEDDGDDDGEDEDEEDDEME